MRNKWSDDARAWRQGLVPHSFMGGDPSVIQLFVSKGMSQIDAAFISDYTPVDKPTLINLLNSGVAPYDALTQMYGGAPYIPNVDNPPLDNYRPPSYAPLPGYPKTMSSIPPSGNAQTQEFPNEVSPLEVIATAKVGGIPIVYIVAAGIAALLLTRS